MIKKYLLMDGDSVVRALVRGDSGDAGQAEALETIPTENKMKIQGSKTDILKLLLLELYIAEKVECQV